MKKNIMLHISDGTAYEEYCAELNNNSTWTKEQFYAFYYSLKLRYREQNTWLYAAIEATEIGLIP